MTTNTPDETWRDPTAPEDLDPNAADETVLIPTAAETSALPRMPRPTTPVAPTGYTPPPAPPPAPSPPPSPAAIATPERIYGPSTPTVLMGLVFLALAAAIGYNQVTGREIVWDTVVPIGLIAFGAVMTGLAVLRSLARRRC